MSQQVAAPARPADCQQVVLVLGDQLFPRHPLADSAELRGATFLFVEAPGECSHVWSHKARIALFLMAMRRAVLSYQAQGLEVVHIRLDAPDYAGLSGLAERLAAWLGGAKPHLHLIRPGDLRVEASLLATADALGLATTIHEDPHFLCSVDEFRAWARGRKQLRMEHFYREMRRKHRVLLEADGSPSGGEWNYDADNRESFPPTGPSPRPPNPPPVALQPADVDVLRLVEQHFPSHPGRLEPFVWPLDAQQAQAVLQEFIRERLPRFGPTQDAMWTDEPFLWHARIASSLNLHLLDPRDVIAEAEGAYQRGHASLASVEGFIRQVLGWREFIRGCYFNEMPGLKSGNGLAAEQPLPAWFWTGDTQMACQRAVVRQTLEWGYAHHIQRLMVTGLFALTAGLRPQEVADWFLAVYVDAVEWVELPNVAGMALYTNAGRFTSKPYAASGQYIKRMSNYCKGCVYKPELRTGSRACPMTTFYWDFLDRHEALLAANPRTGLMAKSVQRLADDERAAIRDTAQAMRQNIDSL